MSASRLQTAPAAPAAPPAVADEPVTEEPAPAILVQAPAPVRPTPGPPAPVSVSIPATEAIFDAVPGFFELSTSLAVIGTNLLFSLLVLLCLLLATTLFNSTLKENQAVLAAGSMAVLTPILKARESVTGFGWPGASFLARLKPLRAGLFLFATAGIYGALDPSFGWNTNSAILYISLATGLAATTFLYEGAAVFLSSRRFGMAAEMKVFPLALLIAAGSVLLSRITGFHPGVIFGFVSAAAISGSSNARHQGLVVWLPLCGLFAVSLLALVLISPLRDWGDQQGGAWSALPETIAVAVFVGGAQSVVLTLMPVTFNDGHRIWMWSKFAWLALSLPACFIFFHALVNSEADLADLSARSNFGLILAASAGVLLLSVVVWLFFKVRSRSVAQADGASG